MEDLQPMKTIKQRIELLESSGSSQQPASQKSSGSPDARKQRKLQTDAFQMFENKGLVIGPVSIMFKQ